VTGYSGTPLAAKLGVRAGISALAVDAPADYRTRLATFLVRVRKKMRDDASIWVSWPKKASGVPTDLTEDVVRELALPLGLVDVKVCAVDATWSGLKLVVRREQRRSDRSRC
jgi:Protein of unknown function (DUF3052)